MEPAENITPLAREARGKSANPDPASAALDPAPAPAELRARVEAEMAAFGLSRARAAAEIGPGVSAPTLSSWLNGSYGGDNDAVEARIGRWLDTRAERAAHAFGGARLDAHAETCATRAVSAALAYAQAAGDLALIHGPSGRGKTWAAETHCAGRAQAIWLRASPTLTTLPRLLSRLGTALGAGARPTHSMEAEQAIVAGLEGRGALIVVDEAHHLRAPLLDELRCIRDMAGCGLALIGDDTIRMTLARCPQVTGRIGMRVDLKALARDDVAAIAAGPLGRKPGAREMKHLIAAAAGPGGLHGLRRHLARAWMIARGAGREAISEADIEAAAGELS
ncbi:AAA family ATPase [Ruegeria sp.]